VSARRRLGPAPLSWPRERQLRPRRWVQLQPLLQHQLAEAHPSPPPTSPASPAAPHPPLSPPFPLPSATQDFELRGRRIPAGWRVWCHTGPGVLAYNTDTFDPARWLDGGAAAGGASEGGDSGMAAAAESERPRQEQPAGRCPLGFGGGSGGGGNPFGAGPRACVGRPLMLLQLKALLALLVRRYAWATREGAAAAWDIVPAPRPRGGLGGFRLERLPPGEAIALELPPPAPRGP
jgi:hypothetical protein